MDDPARQIALRRKSTRQKLTLARTPYVRGGWN